MFGWNGWEVWKARRRVAESLEKCCKLRPIVQLSSRNSTRMRNLLFLHVCRRSPKTISGVKIMIAAGMLVS
jgi:hypothetical protein